VIWRLNSASPGLLYSLVTIGPPAVRAA